LILSGVYVRVEAVVLANGPFFFWSVSCAGCWISFKISVRSERKWSKHCRNFLPPSCWIGPQFSFRSVSNLVPNLSEEP
ncbi:hypothetical protein VIGAN_10205600, partial [Vigna angularis var. angularis]